MKGPQVGPVGLTGTFDDAPVMDSHCYANGWPLGESAQGINMWYM